MQKILLTILILLSCTTINAQQKDNITIKDKSIIVQPQHTNNYIDTGYTYAEAATNTTYKIYLSSNDKLFILKKSKKTDKSYRYYLNDKLDENIVNEIINSQKNKTEK